MATLQRENGEIYYEVKGEGPPLVALRGLARSIRHWMGFEDKLAQHFRVIVMDNRGMGRTSVEHAPLDTIFDLAGDVADVIKAAGEDSAHIMGVSLGGMITLAMGMKYPDRCRSLTVVNTSIAGQRALRLTPAGIKTVVKGMTIGRKTVHRELSEVLVGSAYPHKAEFAQGLLDIDLQEPPNLRGIIAQLGAAARFRVARQLKSLPIPSLVVYGTDDRFVPFVNSEKVFSLLPNSELAKVAGAGHELFVDKGEEFLEILTAFTAKHDGK